MRSVTCPSALVSLLQRVVVSGVSEGCTASGLNTTPTSRHCSNEPGCGFPASSGRWSVKADDTSETCVFTQPLSYVR